MERINVIKPLRAKGIYLKGNSKPLHNRIIWIAGNFLVVAEDEEDTAPTWYNIDKVDKLEGVEQIKEPPRIRFENAVFL